jgi:cell division protease FtsH
MEKKHQINLWYAFIALMLVLMFQSWWTAYKTVEADPLQPVRAVSEGRQIEEISVKENTIEGKFKDPH